jgi:hypothetical protein
MVVEVDLSEAILYRVPDAASELRPGALAAGDLIGAQL